MLVVTESLGTGKENLIGVGVGIGIGIDKTNGKSTPIPIPTPTPMGKSLGTGKENSGGRSEVRFHAVARTASQIRSFASSHPSALSMTGMSVVSASSK